MAAPLRFTRPTAQVRAVLMTSQRARYGMKICSGTPSRATQGREYLQTRNKAEIIPGTIGAAAAPVVAEPQIFPYEDLYQSLIDKKKVDQSYRYFRTIERLQDQFPYARCTHTGKRVNVWCSNDYVGTEALTSSQ